MAMYVRFSRRLMYLAGSYGGFRASMYIHKVHNLKRLIPWERRVWKTAECQLRFDMVEAEHSRLRESLFRLPSCGNHVRCTILGFVDSNHL